MSSSSSLMSSLTFNSLRLHHPPSKSRTPLLLLLSAPISFQRLSKSQPIIIIKSQSQSQSQSQTLPPNLQSIVNLFQSVPDSKLKYQQLLTYGTQLPPFPPQFKDDAHRVRGCVSQVWLRAYPDPDDPSKVRFDADSDSQLTKGLAALLVRGLSGEPPEAIAALSPDFVDRLGLSQSLTPSRNNGFLNMFKMMQAEAAKIAQNNGGSGGRKERIRERLERELSPVELDVDDVSHQHAGHAGVRGTSGEETHFNVRVVSEEFRDEHGEEA